MLFVNLSIFFTFWPIYLEYIFSLSHARAHTHSLDIGWRWASLFSVYTALDIALKPRVYTHLYSLYTLSIKSTTLFKTTLHPFLFPLPQTYLHLSLCSAVFLFYFVFYLIVLQNTTLLQGQDRVQKDRENVR